VNRGRKGRRCLPRRVSDRWLPPRGHPPHSPQRQDEKSLRAGRGSVRPAITAAGKRSPPRPSSRRLTPTRHPAWFRIGARLQPCRNVSPTTGGFSPCAPPACATGCPDEPVLLAWVRRIQHRFVSGHGFSRAVTSRQPPGASAPARRPPARRRGLLRSRRALPCRRRTRAVSKSSTKA